MIDRTRIVSVVLERVAALPVGDYVELRTYKRNRAIFIARLDEGRLRVIEDGYEHHRFTIAEARLKKLLKSLLRREFPRSNKVRFYNMGRFDEASALETPWKKL